jgi:DNA-directed RNA polymerase sigma subunit (sigma70/sigma32)
MRLPVVQESCALEAAELGGMTLEEIATRLSLTRERVRQIEYGALTKMWPELA